MELFLQFGFGMMNLCRELTERWGGSTTVLSPRDLTYDQAQKLSEDIVDLGGDVLFDPQFYVPRANHHKLTSWEYWPSDYTTSSFFEGDGLYNMLERIDNINENLNCPNVILPGLLTDRVDDIWIDACEAIITQANDQIDKELIATIALSPTAMRDENQIERIIEEAENWDVNGFYLIPENPGDYLIEDPIWLGNLLLLTSGLKLLNKKVIVGYSSHQNLILACANVDAVCSGTWLNVRSFSPSKFNEPDEDDIQRQKTWFYCPQSFSEYKLLYLDLAQRLSILPHLEPLPSLGSTYANPLFSGVQPSTIKWSRTDAFRHYLTCLRSQILNSKQTSYRETFEYIMRELGNAEGINRSLSSRGIRGQGRDFSEKFDACRAALLLFNDIRGLHLERNWR